MDGLGLRSVTQLQDATVSLGSWSPDGRSLAFDATIGDKTHIYHVPVGGGAVKRLTDGTATEIDPEWSRTAGDLLRGERIGQVGDWKVPAGGGARTRLTAELGFEPRESPDGSIYFIDRPRYFGLGPVATLKRVSVHGGAAEKVDVPVMPGHGTSPRPVSFSSSSQGWAARRTSRVPRTFCRCTDFAQRRIRTLGTLPFRVGPFGVNHFLTVSRDGQWAVASHVDRWDRDIFVVDGFR